MATEYQYFVGLEDDAVTWRLVLNAGTREPFHASVPFGNRRMSKEELAIRCNDAEWAMVEGLERKASPVLRELQSMGWLPTTFLVRDA
jgi:hypothetical protein